MTYLYSILALAGIAVLWRKVLVDHPYIQNIIQANLGYFSNALLCGLCFTYWISLGFVLVYNPIQFQFPLHHYAQFFFSWMAVAFGAVFLRFLYVAIQEIVHYQVHHLRGDHTH